MKRLLIILLFLTTLCEAAEQKFCSIARSFNAFPNARCGMGYNAGKFIGIKKDYFELSGFLPFKFKEQWLTFTEAKIYRFENSKWGTSIGAGARRWVDDCAIFGTNFYYDYRESNIRGGFHRVGLGLEWLTRCFDVRLNSYIPFNTRAHSSLRAYHNYIGNYLATCREKESCIHEGLDAEIGKSLTCWNDFRLYGAIGPYYYHARHARSFWGCQARLELFWRSYVSLQLRTSYDKRYHVRTQAQILLSFPLDALWCSEPFEDVCEKILSQPVARNGIIFTQRRYTYTTNY